MTIEGGISKSRRVARGGPTRLEIIASSASSSGSGDCCPICRFGRYRGAFRTHPRCSDAATALARGDSVETVLGRFRFSPSGARRMREFAARGLSREGILSLVNSR